MGSRVDYIEIAIREWVDTIDYRGSKVLSEAQIVDLAYAVRDGLKGAVPSWNGRWKGVK